MAKPPEPSASPQRQTLWATRLMWSWLLLGEILLIGVVALFRGRHTLEFLQPWMGRRIVVAALAGAPVCVAVGYHLRNQIYKRHWRGAMITPRGYFLGNQILFLVCAADALAGWLGVLAEGSWWPGFLPAVLMLAVMAVNYPNGRAMEPAAVEWDGDARK